MASGEDLGWRFPLIPMTNPTLPPDAKRLRDVEPMHKSMAQLCRRVRESASPGHSGMLRTQDSAGGPVVPTEPLVARAQPKRRVPLSESRGARLQREYARAKGKLTLLPSPLRISQCPRPPSRHFYPTRSCIRRLPWKSLMKGHSP